MKKLYNIFIFLTLAVSFLISLLLWKVDYLNLRSQYKTDISFYEVIVNSLGNVRYTLASYLWIRTEFYIHYSGDVAVNQVPEIVYYARFITVLNPNFVEAYDFGAYQLAFFLNNPFEGLNFAREGIKNNPDYWKLYYTAGMIYTQKIKDYKEGGKCFFEAERLALSPVTTKKYSKIEDNEFGILYRFIAKCLYEQRDYRNALEYYNKSLNYIKIKADLYYEIVNQLYGR
ncbi:MAG: hypothetical protein RMJ36_03440 [Candidatus Calescibacterium sp.]|nr:hypothetical protein [Candidatus Calescibacterium sp.]MDW8132690.1 hypothetical protein [Candidatus Calescibacterium sp.]